MDNLAQKAIKEALLGNWKEAISLNKEILKENPKDVDTLNRLARAYSETGKVNLAKKSCQKVLLLDPLNSIAEKSLSKWKALKGRSSHSGGVSSPEEFLEEPGKTKLVDLLHPGPVGILASLDAGDEVKLIPHAHRVNVIVSDGKYIGRLPDDLAARLRRLMGTGYEYKIVVKSIHDKDIKIFIRETKKENPASPPSFPPEKIEYASFTPPELVHKREEEILIPEEVE